MRRTKKPKTSKRSGTGNQPSVSESAAPSSLAAVKRTARDEEEPHLKMQSGDSFQASGPIKGSGEYGCYVYGIMAGDSLPSLGKTAIGGEVSDVFAVYHSELRAIASKVTTTILDATRENALAHEHVLERIMATRTIIPMSFGTIFRSEDDIRQMLKSIYPSLMEVLDKMEGKIEFGLKVSWDREKVIETLKREKEEIRRFTAELAKKRLQSTYLARMQLGRMIEQALTERTAELVKDIYETLRPVCVASRDNKPIGDKMIMNAAFLLEREKEVEFDKTVNQIAKRFENLLSFRYSGPWPPYNFVNIRLKLEAAAR